MDVDKIEQLIRVLEDSPNEELCIQKGDYKVCIKKGTRPTPAPKSPKPSKATAASGASVEPAEPKGLFITAPMVGMLRLTAEQAKVGSEVSNGQAVGSIESMKIKNDIVSRVSGTVAEVLVEDGMPVEYGQPLFRLE